MSNFEIFNKFNFKINLQWINFEISIQVILKLK